MNRPLVVMSSIIALGLAGALLLLASRISATGQDAGRGATPSPAGSPSPAGTSSSPQTSVPSTVWVSVEGDDAAAGSRDAPWRSPQRAVNSGAARVELLGGRHPGFVVSRPGLIIAGRGPSETTVEAQIRVAADDVEVHDLAITGSDGSYQAGLLVDGVAGVRVTGTRVYGNTFGIQLRNAPRATITGNEISGNGSGIEVHGEVGGTTIIGNQIHHNDRAVDASRGANAVVLYKSRGPIEVVDNDLYSNFNPSPEPGTDRGGGAFEVYGASDVVIRGNRIWDSDVLETGTEDGLECRGLVFVRNVAWRVPSERRQEGLVLRCAEDGLVAHNTLDGFDRFAIDIIHRGGAFGGSVEGLRVVNNIITFGRAYSIDNQLPDSVVIDHNVIWNPGSDARHGEYLAYRFDRGNTRSPEELRRWGLDRNGTVANPLFMDRDGRDYRLRLGSPAVDAALPLAGVNDDVPDGQPDIGYLERN